MQVANKRIYYFDYFKFALRATNPQPAIRGRQPVGG